MNTAGPRRPASPGARHHLRNGKNERPQNTMAVHFSRFVGDAAAEGRPRASVSVALCLCGVLLLPHGIAAQPVIGAANRKQAIATRVPNGSIRVDGRLDDEIWAKTTPITDFIQKEPEEGAAPTDPMEVRIAYDDDVLYVPFSQLRFNPRSELTWGLNVYRFRPTLDEADYWILIPRTVRAWSSRFGDLSGLAGIVPPRRIEALPYVAGGSTIDGDRDFSGKIGCEHHRGPAEERHKGTEAQRLRPAGGLRPPHHLRNGKNERP